MILNNMKTPVIKRINGEKHVRIWWIEQRILYLGWYPANRVNEIEYTWGYSAVSE